MNRKEFFGTILGLGLSKKCMPAYTPIVKPKTETKGYNLNLHNDGYGNYSCCINLDSFKNNIKDGEVK